MWSFLKSIEIYLPAIVIFFVVLGAHRYFRDVVGTLNTVQTNVWAMCIISLGAFLMIKGYKSEGSSLLTGGFALLRGPGPQLKSNGELNVTPAKVETPAAGAPAPADGLPQANPPASGS